MTVAIHASPLVLPGSTLPALRLLPAPVTEPPYDDERSAAPVLHLVPAPVAAPVLVPVPDAVPVPVAAAAAAAQACPVPTGGDGGAPARTPTADLSCPRVFAHALVQRLLEVSAGVRPLSQLQRDTTPELYAELERALTARPRATGVRPTSRDVRSVHVQERPDGVAEVCATVRRGARAAALAMRLEGAQGRWLCTELLGV